MIKQLKRIAKAEQLSYVTEDILTKLAANSNGEMRTAANLIEALVQSVGTDAKKVSPEDLEAAISTTVSKDDDLAIVILLGVYAKKFGMVHLALLDVQDGFGLINKMMWLNVLMLTNALQRPLQA